MTLRVLVTGTDTNIGKTVFAAGLTSLLGGCYWKPVQAGLDGETDSAAVARLGGIPARHILGETWKLRTPISPHRAAEIDGMSISAERLTFPRTAMPLVIEGAGGLMVPLTRTATFADVFARWRLPVVLCARTQLGTINHTLLSLEALRNRSIPILGVAFIGDVQPDTERVIAEIGKTRILGRLPWIEPLTPSGLRREFRQAFRVEDFAQG
jgi:dethiobiotin synthetase